MIAFLILPILVAGFIYCHNHPYHLYRLHRHDGQYLYINSAKYGLLSFLAAAFFVSVLDHLTPDTVLIRCLEISIDLAFVKTQAKTLFDEKEADLASWIFSTSVLSLLISYLASRIKWKILCQKLGGKREAKLYVISELLSDSPLDCLLFNLSLEKDSLVMLSLSDRKVYVGKVISLGEPNESEGPDQEIIISPVVSGYRNKDDLHVIFTTNYQSNETDLTTIVIRQDMITSATKFSFEVFEEFKNRNQNTEPPSEPKPE